MFAYYYIKLLSHRGSASAKTRGRNRKGRSPCGIMKLFFILNILVFISLKCDLINRLLNSTSHKNLNIVRAAVKLTNENIPFLENKNQTKFGEKPWIQQSGIVKFKYRWEFSNNDNLSVDLFVAETNELAKNYLTDQRKNASIPMDIYVPKDNPAVVGDISYGNGRQFIRDNILIIIRADTSLIDIAIQIDSLILKSPVYVSAYYIKPKIIKYDIIQNPVKYRSITRLIIEVIDPLDGELYYDWRFTPGSQNWGGIDIDSLGDYYYYADTNEPIEQLTLYAINDSGFYSFKTIYIEVES